MNKAGQILSSNLGNIQKAIITIKDERGIEKKEQKTESRTVGFSFNPVDTQKCMETGVKNYVVKFNPKTLEFSASGQGKSDIINTSQYPPIFRRKEPAQITLTVDLIFDCTNNQAAFIYDKFVLNPTNIIKGAANLIAHKDDTFTIRTQIEGLTAALRNKDTKHVSFVWGRMNYKGTFTNFNATYTMFNPNGEPIQANAKLTIKLDSAFSRMSSGSAVRAGQKASSVLNIQF